MIRKLSLVAAGTLAAIFTSAAQADPLIMVVDSSGDGRVLLLSGFDGSVINPDFILGTAAQNMGTIKEAIQVGGEIWISDQTNDVIWRYTASLSPVFLGTISGGLDNIRGLGVVGNSVFVSNDGGSNGATADSLPRYDFNGVRIGTPTSLPSDSPFDVAAFNGNFLVTDFGTNDNIELFSATGVWMSTFSDGGTVSSPQQVAVANTGPGGVQEVWVAGSSGLHRYDLSGAQLMEYESITDPQGVHPLENGQMLVVDDTGIFTLDPAFDSGVQIASVTTGQYASGLGSTTQLFASGAASPAFGDGGDMITLTANVLGASSPDSTGIELTVDLSMFGGSAAQVMTPQGNNVFTTTLTIPMALAGGNYQIALTAEDDQMRTGTGSIALLVLNGWTAESETNSMKASADAAPLMEGLGVYGVTRGASTATGEENSADYFLITTPSLADGIYRHRMVLTTDGAEGHTASLRGLSQTGGVINAGTDIQIQTGLATSTPRRYVQWYGLGDGTQMYYRVAGLSATTGTYFSVLESEPVTPAEFGGALAPGEITISRGAGNTATVDILIFDEDLNPVAGFNTDGANSLTRTFAEGTYYMAVSDANTTDNRAAGAGSTVTNNSVLDFAGAVINTSQASVADMDMRFQDSGSTDMEIALSKDGIFEVRWVRFTVGGGGTPCPGDYDDNGSVDLADLISFNTNWQPQIGLSVPPGTGGDFDGNGVVDLADLIGFNTAWQPNIGVPCP